MLHPLTSEVESEQILRYGAIPRRIALRRPYATRQRHRRQAHIMHIAIQKRWKLDTPWRWQLKHIRWFLSRYLKNHAPATRYSYLLTTQLICRRLKKNWSLTLAR
jgi:hypothetical protein